MKYPPLDLREAAACHRFERAVQAVCDVGGVDPKERTRVIRHAKAIRAFCEARLKGYAEDELRNIVESFDGTGWEDGILKVATDLRKVMGWST